MPDHSKTKRTRLFTFIPLLFYLTSAFFQHHVSAIRLHPEIPVFQKGICYATWDKNRFASTYSDQALITLKNMGAEYIQINITQYQDRCDSTEIKETGFTPSDPSVKHVIQIAHELGLKVMLKPHIDLIHTDRSTCCRSDIGFKKEKDWRKWFAEYGNFITHYAGIAEEYHVEIFCVGTELSSTTRKANNWRKIISSVRNIYSGKLIYAANWDNYENVKFWQDLDFVGIDAYFPLTCKSDPALEDIKKGWEKWKHKIGSWHSGIKKPIVFTEIGYSSAAGAASEPWKKESRGNADVEIQAKCYTAFFETMWNSPWLTGVYWWKYGPTIYGGGKNNRYFTPLNKPAAGILEENYRSRTRSRSRPRTT